MKRKNKDGHRGKVEISCPAPNAQAVFLAGTFNAWDPTACAMKRDAEGVWHANLQLSPGVYEYKFVIDGAWVCKPGVEESDPAPLSDGNCIPNVFGTANRRLEVA